MPGVASGAYIDSGGRQALPRFRRRAPLIFAAPRRCLAAPPIMMPFSRLHAIAMPFMPSDFIMPRRCRRMSAVRYEHCTAAPPFSIFAISLVLCRRRVPLMPRHTPFHVIRADERHRRCCRWRREQAAQPRTPQSDESSCRSHIPSRFAAAPFFARGAAYALEVTTAFFHEISSCFDARPAPFAFRYASRHATPTFLRLAIIAHERYFADGATPLLSFCFHYFAAAALFSSSAPRHAPRDAAERSDLRHDARRPARRRSGG